jgi:hypothetical protein
MKRRLVIALAGLLALTGYLCPTTGAADSDKVGGSLQLVPADVGFYQTSLRTREQLDAFAKSQAWAKLWSLPLVQAGWKEVVKQYEDEGGKLAGLRQFYAQPENKELVQLLGDAISNEVFCFGGTGWADLLDVMAQLNRANQMSQFEAAIEGQAPNDPGRQIKMMIKTLGRNADRIKIPDLVIGFRLTDAKKAESQLKRLENFLNAVFGQNPTMQGRFKRVQVNGGSYLSLSLDGQMVPWNVISFDNFEDKPGELEALKKQLMAMKISINLGVRDNFLLFAIGESTAPLVNLAAKGEGKTLGGRPEFKPLAKFADRRLTSIGYVSREMRVKLGSANANLDSLVEMARLGLAKADVPAEKRKKLESDLEAMLAEAKKASGAEGATLGFSFLTDRGSEGYSYEWTTEGRLDDSKPLTLLDHVGGTPLFATVSRMKPDPEAYKALVQWIKTAHGHFADIVAPKLEGDAKATYDKVVKELFPLLKRLDEVTANLLLPALADGQTGLVFDAKWSSKQWFDRMPAAEKPLPMLEMALVLGVSDADKLRKALGEYRTIFNEMLAKAKDFAPPGKEVPNLQIPKPQTEKAEAGELYVFSLPKDWGLDAQVAPTAGVSQSVFAVALSRAHAERLLASKPLKATGGPLANAKRPLGAATYCDWPALIDALAPWVEFGLAAIPADEIHLPLEGDLANGEKARDEIRREARVVLEVLKCFRGYTSVTYKEDGAQVTHYESVYKDLEK